MSLFPFYTTWRRALLAMLALTTASLYNPAHGQQRYAQQVNTMVGTRAGGNTYPGATYPFGMVQFTRPYFSKQQGFGINQLSGAGCDHMGNFPVVPLNGPLTISPDSIINLRTAVSNEAGHAGYYHCVVDDNISTALTVTPRTGMARFDYAPSAQKATIIIGGGVASTPTAVAAVKITGSNSCEGYAEGGSFCGVSTPYKVYFVAAFDHDASSSGTWKNNQLHPKAGFAEGEHSGVYFTFDLTDAGSNQKIQYKIGVSYVSVENARRNLMAENPDWDFEAIKKKAADAWNQFLGKIEIQTENKDRATQFYTHFYHALLHPNICSDINGDYMGADNQVHRTSRTQYTSFSNWDTYRTQIQLLSILFPEKVSDMVSSLEDFARQSGGGFPRWVLANTETGIMQGDPTTILIANAFAFGARNYNARAVQKTMLHGAEDTTAHAQNKLTRPGLKQYKEKGYYNASIQLEYSSADFALSRFVLGASDDQYTSYQYLQRAQGWKNLYNPKRKWLQSRNPDGSWKAYNEDWREATYKNYFWMVPFNLKALIDTIGGKKVAEQRLDTLFTRLDANYGQDWYAAGNEPGFGAPWIYNWAGAQYKAQQTVRRVIQQQYFNAADGLPGNDDLGAMGAFYVFCCLGIYPEIPGVAGFSISSPVFNAITLHLKNGDFVIDGGSEQDPYIKTLQLNGHDYNNTWISWEKMKRGGHMHYKLSSRPNKSWGTQKAPPSFD